MITRWIIGFTILKYRSFSIFIFMLKRNFKTLSELVERGSNGQRLPKFVRVFPVVLSLWIFLMISLYILIRKTRLISSFTNKNLIENLSYDSTKRDDNSQKNLISAIYRAFRNNDQIKVKPRVWKLSCDFCFAFDYKKLWDNLL